MTPTRRPTPPEPMVGLRVKLRKSKAAWWQVWHITYHLNSTDIAYIRLASPQPRVRYRDLCYAEWLMLAMPREQKP